MATAAEQNSVKQRGGVTGACLMQMHCACLQRQTPDSRQLQPDTRAPADCNSCGIATWNLSRLSTSRNFKMCIRQSGSRPGSRRAGCGCDPGAIGLHDVICAKREGFCSFAPFFKGLTGEGQGLTASFSLVRVEGRTSLHRQEAARSEVVVPGPRMPRPHSVAAALIAHPAITCCTYKQDDAFQGRYHASGCSATEALSHMLDTA